MEVVKISVYSIVDSSHCILAEDGEKVYEKIKEAFGKDKPVELSFLNIELLAPAFINAAIGKLYESFSEEKIRKSLFVRNISDKDRELIKKVVNEVKIHQKGPELLAKVIKEFLRK
ncbi:MAG: STAS-like domain-containing protein [Clostridia bacterium]|nr:STAS-like domain-containing protein [Clostridia bacterium]